MATAGMEQLVALYAKGDRHARLQAQNKRLDEEAERLVEMMQFARTTPKHALGLVQYLRTIGHSAWVEDTSGNEIDEKALKMAIGSRHEEAPSS